MRPHVRWFFVMIAFAAVLLAVLAPLQAQPEGGKKGNKKGAGGNETAAQFADKVMAFNKAKDGKLTKAELTDTRLLGLFDRADANKDGVVTREELEALHARESAGGGDKGDFGDKKGKGPKDQGPEGKKGKGFGGPPGQVLPPFLLDALNLTDTQRKNLASLQREVDSRLESILTSDQRAMLRGLGDKKGPPPSDR